jgi:hypothetical protein
VYETFKIQGEKEQLSAKDADQFAEAMRSTYYDWLHRYYRTRLFAEAKLEDK